MIAALTARPLYLIAGIAALLLFAWVQQQRIAVLRAELRTERAAAELARAATAQRDASIAAQNRAIERLKADAAARTAAAAAAATESLARNAAARADAAARPAKTPEELNQWMRALLR